MHNSRTPEHIDTVVIGAGQAGLSVGYHLATRGLPFAILDGNERVGDPWRNRWESLRLFTPAKFDGLDGMRFPANGNEFVTKDEMASFLERYVSEFELPVRTGMRIDHLSKANGRFELSAGERTITADQVVVAMSSYQAPKVPAFAADLDPSITQLHSHEYRGPSQLQPGGVLVVGAGNSGAEIAKEVVADHPTWLSGRNVGQIPFKIDGLAGRTLLVRLVLRGMFHRVLTVGTPMGRGLRPKVLAEGGPLIRVKTKELDRLGVQRVPRTGGVADGQPVLEDGQALPVTNVIWCTGYHPGFSWIDLPVLGEHEPDHHRGIVDSEPGLYFVGLEFLSSMSSNMVHGVGRDAAHVVKALADRVSQTRSSEALAAAS